MSNIETRLAALEALVPILQRELKFRKECVQTWAKRAVEAEKLLKEKKS